MHILNKRTGETPLELIRRTFPTDSTPRTYAGRLDPMASGLMIILEGDEVHDKTQYLELTKTYELEILFGISTDSYDTLGLITNTQLQPQSPKTDPPWTDDSYPCTFDQPYPPYSSRTVDGKPLWWWTREGRLDEITIPTKSVTIHSLTLQPPEADPPWADNSLSILIPKIISNVNLVKGDFRQNKIIKSWQSLLTKHPNTSLQIANLTVSCSSGTYMRSLAHNIGKKLSIPSLALSIHRTRVGDYLISSR